MTRQGWLPTDRARLERLLASWRDSLIDLSFRNRLLNYQRRSSSAGMDLVEPGLSSVLEGLSRGCAFAAVRGEASDDENNASGGLVPLAKVVPASSATGARPIDTPASRAGVGSNRPTVKITTSKATQAEQDRHLRRLALVAREKYNDYGLWVLHLGVGFLDWTPAPSAEKSFSSPLVMVPVVLERRRGDSYVLKANADEEPTLNPALAIKMGELGVDWPRVEQVEQRDIPALIAQVRRAVAGMRGWKVTSRIVLDTFNSSKEVMYRDLLDNAARVQASALVRAIGLGADSGLSPGTFAFEPADTDRIDEIQPPEKAPLVLDADSSQRQCVAAAIEGRSFVMDGPPGTGKSQTITNVIAGLLEQGRTVLFVSEKAAALDVVRNRLSNVGLDDYVLALHSNSTGRKQVAQELGQALRPPPRRTSSGGARADLQRVRQLRQELSGYAAAMNETRPGLGMSLHEVLGRISLLDSSHPLPADRAFDAEALTAEGLDQVRVAARQVSRSWRPALEGTAFSWYGMTDAGNPLQALDRATEALSDLDTRLLPHAALLGELDWQGVCYTARLTTLLHVAGARPTLPHHWLTADHHGLTTAVTDFRRRLDEVMEAERSARQMLGAAWERLPAEADPAPSAEETALSAVRPPAIDIGALTADGARELGDRLEVDAAALDEAVQSLAAVGAMYGLPAPESCDDALRLGHLAVLAGRPDDAKPLPPWLTREGAADARTAAQVLRKAVRRLRETRRKAEEVFTDRVLQEASLEEVTHRFATVHRSITGRLSAACRADRRLVRSLLPDGGKCTKAVVAALPAAVAWQQAARTLYIEADRHASALGTHWRGEDTDFDGVDSLIALADDILKLVPRVLNPDALAREVASGGAPHPAAGSTAERAAARLTEWRDSLVLPPTPGPSYELEPGSLRAAAQWSRAHIVPLRAAEQLIRIVEETAVASGAVGAPGTWTLSAARASVHAVQAARTAAMEFESRAGGDRELLGDLYTGRSTSVSDLTAAFGWISTLREACGLQSTASLSASAAEILYHAEADTELEAAAGIWTRATEALVDLFRPERAEQLREAFSRGQEAALKVLAVLDGDRGGPDEWRAYDRGRRALDDLSLGDLVDRAVRRGVAPADFPALVERAALRAWADFQLSGDPRLGTTRSADRDDLVAGFRELDAKLADQARARVIQTCDARRSRTTDASGVALLRREGEKKTRHKPVRELLESARETVRLIKPCFMMSPLTVSRFLPPDLVFDVVIFDEASQVLPQDAINCVYRGRALIVAGDQKQLPPTAFFSSTGDDEGDTEDEELPEKFDSVLDLCKASGLLPSLSLRWHYRSRHEDLIAFSNREFYDESMTTFPGAHAEGPDVGVAFYRAREGVYRSGTAAQNNPGEAAEVARRVIHHFSTRKGRSLGVVALSQSQAVAIQDAVDAARRDRPDLDECFSEDRLNGFFVKNLESVQGDERDVMILSVGYGPDAHGKISRNFGPMNKADGWRRLNVAVTRARYRVEVVASFDPDEVPVGNTGKSFRHLHRYLQYAQRGPSVLSHEGADPDAQPESPFEVSVLAVLRGWGYDVQPQVGVAGYRIDLGVRHPRWPGRYALGVECDGAMYHSSKAARDRDRLREGVLRGLNWELHRIWSTDWYRDRSGAEARLRAAVERAVALPVGTRTGATGVAEGDTAEPEASSRALARSGPAQRFPAGHGAGTRTAPASTRSRAGQRRTVPTPRHRETPSAVTYPVTALAKASRERVENELSQIREYLRQPEPLDTATDYRVRADNRCKWEKRREQLEERATFLESFLGATSVIPRTTGGATVAPGRMVGLSFDGSADVEEYEITSQSPVAEDGQTLSPFTPLAAALLWRGAGLVEYEDGSGKRRTAHIRHVRD